MGYGAYSSIAHESITASRVRMPTQAVFAQTACHALMNPKGMKVRESRDSAEPPESLGIVFALDVTGSMGAVPEMLARKELPRFMSLLEAAAVKDPQILFMAIGDATSDRAPLQVGQFETTAELMDQWLTWSYLEGCGGSFGAESYELGLYFLAQHTDMDCLVKRRKRGYAFMTGDELPYPAISRLQVDALIGDRLEEDLPIEEVVAAVQESYHFFFIIPNEASRQHCERRWRDLIGDHVIVCEDAVDTCAVAAGAIALSERAVTGLDELDRRLSKTCDPSRVRAVIRALGPYAATLGMDENPAPPLDPSGPSKGPGLLRRLLAR
jgi:hypothetical protein